MADLEKSALGVPDLGIAIIEHPLVYRTAEEIEAIADDLVERFAARFGGSG